MISNDGTLAPVPWTNRIEKGGSCFSSSSDGILVLSVTASLRLQFKLIMFSSAPKIHAEGKLLNALSKRLNDASILAFVPEFNLAG
jgi:hypothetical protein